MKTFLLWILYFLAAEAVLTILRYALRKRKSKPVGRACLILLKALLATGFAGLVMGGPVFVLFQI